MSKPSRRNRNPMVGAPAPGAGGDQPPYLIYSVVCTDVPTEPDGVKSFRRIVTRFGVRQPDGTAVPPGMTVPVVFNVVNGWGYGVGHFHEYLTISDPNGNEVIATPEENFWLQNRSRQHNVIHQIQMGASQSGPYHVRVFLGGEVRCEYLLQIDLGT